MLEKSRLFCKNIKQLEGGGGQGDGKREEPPMPRKSARLSAKQRKRYRHFRKEVLPAHLEALVLAGSKDEADDACFQLHDEYADLGHHHLPCLRCARDIEYTKRSMDEYQYAMCPECSKTHGWRLKRQQAEAEKERLCALYQGPTSKEGWYRAAMHVIVDDLFKL